MAKTQTIQYRQLKTEGLWPEADLKAMLVDVLSRRRDGQVISANAKLLIIDIDQDQSFVILNKISDPKTWAQPVFAGQLIQLQAGADVQAIIQSLDEDTSEFMLQNLNVGGGARVLKGALYFAVVGNHVGLIEGQQVRGRMLERYLTRLFQDAGELQPGHVIILNSKFTTGDGKELSESSEITITAKPSYSDDGPPRDRYDQISEREAARAQDEGRTVFDVLELLGWDKKAIDSIKADVPRGGWVEGFFRVLIKERKKRKNFSKATINEALRNIDPDDLGLKGDGSQKGDIVKLSTKKVITSVGSLIDPEDAMIQIIKAVREWADRGKIDCNFDA